MILKQDQGGRLNLTEVFALKIRQSVQNDIQGLLKVEREAFGEAEGPEIVELVTNLLEDSTAKPYLSMVAVEEGIILGHILFTNATITNHESTVAVILAPLAVDPDRQNKGIGGKLVEAGFKSLSKLGTDLVFVLGHPTYYPRFGFLPANDFGLEAPYPIAEHHADAWMVKELKPGILSHLKGKVNCAAAMMRPEYWRE